MEEVRARRFFAEVVELDNKEFVYCEFFDCELRYSGGPVSLVETGLVGCRWAFGGAARRTISMLECFELQTNEAATLLAPSLALPN